MFFRVTSVALVGVEPRPVQVEVHVGSASKAVFTIVGLPDAAVREAKERVRAALRSAGYSLPGRRVIVNLSPADLPKGGSAYDLPIALGVLAASRQIKLGEARLLALGELGLDGAVRSVRGGFGAAIVGRDLDIPVILPREAAAEAAAFPDATVYSSPTLNEAIAAALGDAVPLAAGASAPVEDVVARDMSEVRGQAMARRALEVAAAGGHHMLMTGPPGVGKTLLAEVLPGILPPLPAGEQLEVALAHAAAGLSRFGRCAPPFRAPHHSATLAALVGGGTGVPVPGEVTLAHRGVLFLDELGEIPSHLLDALRQPIEDGRITIARKGSSVTFPSRMQVIGATNPCPCGYYEDDSTHCRCSERSRDRYRARLSGPLIDRFDVRMRLSRVSHAQLTGPPGEASRLVRARVAAARKRQWERGGLNSELSRVDLDALDWEPGADEVFAGAMASYRLSPRGWDRMRKVAVTVADLAESASIGERHAAEAVSYRAS